MCPDLREISDKACGIYDDLDAILMFTSIQEDQIILVSELETPSTAEHASDINIKI